MSTIIIVITVVAYMLFMVGVGVVLSRKNTSTHDFYLGGRQLGPFVTAMSAEASDMSSYLLMGVPGVALAGLVGMNGSFAEALWTVLGLSVGTYINWLLVAKRLRIYSEKVDAHTIPDFFANRFGQGAEIILIMAAVIIIIFFVPYTASGFASVGKLFNSLFGWNYHTAMIVGAVIIAAYTALGGFLAASTTDFIQSIIMTFALVIVLFYGISVGDGVDGIVRSTNDVPNYFSLTGPDGNFGIITIISTISWGLGYFGMPHILLRFMAIKDDKKLKLSRRIASVWVVIAMTVAVFIGVLGYAFVTNHNLISIRGFDPERIIIYIADTLSHINPFFAVVAGLIISGILASIMSTSDSQMLAAASSVSENIIKRGISKDIDDKKQMLIARLTVLIITVIGVCFAWNQNSSVFRIVSFAWAGFGASFGPLMLFSLFWRRLNKWGAFAGIVSGAGMIFIWKFGIAKLGGVFAIYELMPAFLTSCLAIIIVSLLTKKPDEEVVEIFDEVKNLM